MFTDITVGNNCQDEDCLPKQSGFYAHKGWDPVTGLGSPRFPQMREYITQLAHRVVRRRQARRPQQPM